MNTQFLLTNSNAMVNHCDVNNNSNVEALSSSRISISNADTTFLRFDQCAYPEPENKKLYDYTRIETSPELSGGYFTERQNIASVGVAQAGVVHAGILQKPTGSMTLQDFIYKDSYFSYSKNLESSTMPKDWECKERFNEEDMIKKIKIERIKEELYKEDREFLRSNKLQYEEVEKKNLYDYHTSIPPQTEKEDSTYSEASSKLAKRCLTKIKNIASLEFKKDNEDWLLPNEFTYEDIEQRIQEDFINNKGRIKNEVYRKYIGLHCRYLFITNGSSTKSLIIGLRKIADKNKEDELYKYKQSFIKKISDISRSLTKSRKIKEQDKILEKPSGSITGSNSRSRESDYDLIKRVELSGIPESWKFTDGFNKDYMVTRIQQDFINDNSRIIEKGYLDYFRAKFILFINKHSNLKTELMSILIDANSNTGSASYKEKKKIISQIRVIVRTKMKEEKQQSIIGSWRARRQCLEEQYHNEEKEPKVLEQNDAQLLQLDNFLDTKGIMQVDFSSLGLNNETLHDLCVTESSKKKKVELENYTHSKTSSELGKYYLEKIKEMLFLECEQFEVDWLFVKEYKYEEIYARIQEDFFYEHSRIKNLLYCKYFRYYCMCFVSENPTENLKIIEALREATKKNKSSKLYKHKRSLIIKMVDIFRNPTKTKRRQERRENLRQQSASDKSTDNQIYSGGINKFLISKDWIFNECSLEYIKTRIQQDFIEENPRICNEEYLNYFRDKCLSLLHLDPSCKKSLMEELRKAKDSNKNNTLYKYKKKKLDFIISSIATRKWKQEQKQLMKDCKEKNYNCLHTIANIRRENVAVVPQMHMFSREPGGEQDLLTDNSDSLLNQLISLPILDETHNSSVQLRSSSLEENKSELDIAYVSRDSHHDMDLCEDQITDNFLKSMLEGDPDNQIIMESMIEMNKVREADFSH